MKNKFNFRYMRKHPLKATMVSLFGIALLVTLGSSVYAALGGATRTANSGDIELQKGLVGWWQLNGNAKDSTPYSNNGTVTGATLTTDRKGKANAAYAFANSSQYIDAGAPTIMNSMSYITASVWVYPTATTTFSTALDRWNDTGTAKGDWNIGIGGTAGQFRFAIYTTSGTTYNIASATNFSLNQWHLLTGTYDGSTVNLYVDGTITATTAATGTLASVPETLRIGQKNGGQGPWPGRVGEARVYNRALSTNEAKALYNQYSSQVSLANGNSGLVGWWKMDGNLTDATPYNHGCTPTNMTLISDRKGAGNSAYSFNGTSSSASCNSPGILSPTYISVSAWVNATANTAFATAVSKYDQNSTANGSWMLGLDGSSHYRFLIFNSGTFSAVNPSVVATSGWHHLTGTYDGTNIKLYVDGQLQATTSETGTLATNAASVIFGNRLSGTAYWNGSIDDVRIYNHALSATEVATLAGSYNSQVQLSNLQKGLVGDWPMNGNAKDATPYGNNGGSITATLTSDREGRASSAYAFNGSSKALNLTPNPAVTTAMSVSIWTNQSTLGNYYNFAKNQWTTVAGSWIMFADSGGSAYFGIYDTSQKVAQCTGGTVTTNSWHHMVGTYDGTTVKLYYDGTLCTVYATLSGQTITSSGSINLGGSSGAASTYNEDDLRIYNRALSQTEVTSLYKTYR